MRLNETDSTEAPAWKVVNDQQQPDERRRRMQVAEELTA
jgi:hypothetical protein